MLLQTSPSANASWGLDDKKNRSVWKDARNSGSCLSRLLKDVLLPGLLKKAQMQGGVTHLRWVPGEVRGVLGTYVAAPRERANAADGPFSAAC